MVLLAAAYSICWKPQCGHCRLTLAGDEVATGREGDVTTTQARTPNAVLTGEIGSSLRTISGLCTGAELIFPLVTSDLPMKVAPSSMTRRVAFRSPCNVQRDFSSQRSATVMLPCTLPNTVIDFVLISPRISAFSPIVRTP